VVDDRLLETSELPLERELLRAAAEEGPPSAARVRSLAALGLLGVATPAAAAGLGTTSATSSAGAAGALGLPWLFKWGLVLGIGASAVGGAIVVERSVRPVDSTAVDAAVEPTVAEPRTEQPAGATTSSPSDTMEQRVEEPPPQPQAPRRAAAPRRDKEAPPSTPGAVSIRAEVRLLDRARAELARNASDAALATLAEYSARFPRGTLREEAAVIRIDALRASGRDHAASREEHEFQRHFPSSAHQLDAGAR
jgi:hypothetical protein